MVHSLLVVDFTDAGSYSHYDIWNPQLGKLDIPSILTVFRITIKYCCCQTEEEMRVCRSCLQSLQSDCHDHPRHQRSEFAFVVAESFVLWQCVGTILAGKKGSAGEGREAQKEQEQEERYLLRGLYYFQKMSFLYKADIWEIDFWQNGGHGDDKERRYLFPLTKKSKRSSRLILMK